MNLSLFVSQLNQGMQNPNMMCLEDVCELLQTHTQAAVSIADIELLQPDKPRRATNFPHNAVSQDTTICEGEISEPSQYWEQKEDNEFRMTLPIMAGDIVLGHMSLSRFGGPFSEDENLAFGVAVSICTILLRQRSARLLADTKRSREVVRNLINTLSFSELEAIMGILKEFNKTGKTEGLVVAGKIADKLGFTRSIITTGLKKLESAGVVETRSLGMKGTYIRVKDLLLLEEIGKL